MAVTFGLTLLIPLQYAVLIGVGMSMILYVVRQANQLETRRLVVRDDGGIEHLDRHVVDAATETALFAGRIEDTETDYRPPPESGRGAGAQTQRTVQSVEVRMLAAHELSGALAVIAGQKIGEVLFLLGRQV